MTRFLIWALVDLVATILLVAIAVGEFDQGAWPVAVAALALAAWCFVVACQDLDKWAES